MPTIVAPEDAGIYSFVWKPAILYDSVDRCDLAITAFFSHDYPCIVGFKRIEMWALRFKPVIKR